MSLLGRMVLATICFAFAVNFGWAGVWLWFASLAVPFVTKRPWQGWVIAVIVGTGFFASYGASDRSLDFNPDFGQGPDMDGGWITGLIGSIGWGWLFFAGLVLAVALRRLAPRS